MAANFVALVLMCLKKLKIDLGVAGRVIGNHAIQDLDPGGERGGNVGSLAF